ncbi:glycosyl transferases group 1-domain-containing protein [Leucosporidium creatinivorum]|uniref:Chitobiosyldiphosphodolichol beta-mannosyltransferase n=1 Tax=Leucosporidium creatinivorum TaxID=106004 RepID=A0A1Y2C7H9_9BASI|nr:glycosyl transferases group 1-domain-containing protein [Leucosporidium creatinivorum]
MDSASLTLLLGLATSFLVLLKWPGRGRRPATKSVAIVVLGDIGRSPRMLYHATSFVERGYATHIVAYRGSTPPRELLESPHAHFVYLPTPLAFVSKLPKPLFLLLSPLKVVAAAVALLWALVARIDSPPRFMFVQNPPAIPTLPVVKLASFMRGSKVMIDWHNTGYSVLALRLGENHPVVKLAKWIETFWGQRAYAHLCVTEAMKEALIRDAQLQGRTVVFHDRPPAHFRRQTDAEAHELFSRLETFASDPSLTDFVNPSPSPPFTLFTTPEASGASFLPDHPALLVSATSWTADEDFSILLSALDLYNKAATSYAAGKGGLKGSDERAARLPKVMVVITGKGAGKAAFEKEVERLEKGWSHVRVRTAWLALEDYPRLLGSADLGISLHASTSGVDLPMKVVDMFGCGLPVCALDFPCVGELVQDGINGRTFRSAQDLADQLVTLLRPFPSNPEELLKLRRGILEAEYGGEKWSTWDENWEKVVAPLLQ